MKLIILFIACSTVFNQELTCPEPPQDCRLPCPLGTCCTCQNPCPATCNDTIPTPCPTLWCNPGCYKICPECHVLNQIGGYCIPLEMCEEDEEDDCCTRHNEIYYECKPCIGTCRAPKPNCTLELCGEPAGCDCEEGLVRDEKTGKCVNPDSPSCKEQRGTQCGPNEVLAACGSAICQENRCDNSTIACPQLCAEPPLGFCVCKEGLYRDTKTGLCVDPNEPSCLEQRGPQCGPGEVLVQVDCGDIFCGIQYCDNFHLPCNHLCYPPGGGPLYCFCKDGLFRDRETGLCVDPNSPSCKRQRCNDDTEQYYTCSTESCQPICYDECPNETICKKPGNCDCKPGLVRDIYNTSKCVKPDECTYICPNPDEQFHKYAWPCEQTCDNYPDFVFCPDSLFFPGSCLCNEGLIRDTITGKCVKPDDPSCLFQSSPDCTIPGEHYYICNTTDCERTCQKPVVDCPNEAIGICNQPGNCDCKPQLVRDLTTGQCVYMDSPSCIAQRCRQDQKYYQCSTKNCFPTCDNPTPLCKNICIEPGNCDCKPGLLRTESGDCIKPESCPTPECDDNEQYYNCSTANCQRTCKEPNPICTEECITPGNCDCKIGLVRDTKNGQCCHPNKKSCKKQRIKP